MTTTFMKGDLFEDGRDEHGRAHAFAFGADASGSLGQGISVAFAKRWPAFAEAFREAKHEVGEVFAWDAGGGVFVYALVLAGADKKPKVSTLTRSLEAMFARAQADGVHRIALARIGAGKDGIDPVRVKRVLTELGVETAISLVVFEQFVRRKAPEADEG